MATNQYSFAQACAILGISAHTLRRRIQAGEVRAERITRPQGYAWTVYLEQAPGSRDVSDVTTNEPAATWQPEPAAAGSRIADGQQLAIALAPLVEASVTAAVAPLRAELADVRALLSARDQAIGQRDQEIGQLRAVLTHVMAAKDAGSAAPEQKRAPWWAIWRWAAST